MTNLFKLILVFNIIFSSTLSSPSVNQTKNTLLRDVFSFDWNYLLNNIVVNNNIDGYRDYLKKKYESINLLSKRYPKFYQIKIREIEGLKKDLIEELDTFFDHNEDYYLIESVERLRVKYQTWTEWILFKWDKYKNPIFFMTGAMILLAGSYFIVSNFLFEENLEYNFKRDLNYSSAGPNFYGVLNI